MHMPFLFSESFSICGLLYVVLVSFTGTTEKFISYLVVFLVCSFESRVFFEFRVRNQILLSWLRMSRLILPLVVALIFLLSFFCFVPFIAL